MIVSAMSVRALYVARALIIGAISALGLVVLAASPATAAPSVFTYDAAAYSYDGLALLSLPDTSAMDARGSPSGQEAGSRVSPVSSARFGVAANGAGDAPYLYRGLAEDHPGLADAKNGIARPRGGHADPARHNGGNTVSEFTSWTTDESIARGIAAEASGPGAVLRIPNANGPGYVRVPSPDVYGESEVLIRGPVTGADVLPWEPTP